MRRWPDSGSVDRTDRWGICYLVSRCTAWLAVRLHCNFHVVRRSNRRAAVSLEPEASAKAADRILSDLGSIGAADWPHLLLCSSFTQSALQDRGYSHGPCAARVGHGVNSGSP